MDTGNDSNSSHGQSVWTGSKRLSRVQQPRRKVCAERIACISAILLPGVPRVGKEAGMGGGAAECQLQPRLVLFARKSGVQSRLVALSRVLLDCRTLPAPLSMNLYQTGQQRAELQSSYQKRNFNVANCIEVPDGNCWRKDLPGTGPASDRQNNFC